MARTGPRHKPGKIDKQEEPLTELQELAMRMRQAALEAGLTQRQIAIALQINQATVSNWHQGETQPFAIMLYRYAVLVGKPIGWFFREVSDPVADHEWRIARLEKFILEKKELLPRREPYKVPTRKRKESDDV